MVFSIEGAAGMWRPAGLGSSRIAFYDYGVQSYANVIFTSGQLVQENPAVVQRFVNAVLRGLQYVVERPAEVAAWFVEHYGEELHPLQVDVQDEAVLAIIPLIQTATSKPGMMSAETWDYLDTNMVELGLLDASVNVEAMYTMQILILLPGIDRTLSTSFARGGINDLADPCTFGFRANGVIPNLGEGCLFDPTPGPYPVNGEGSKTLCLKPCLACGEGLGMG